MLIDGLNLGIDSNFYADICIVGTGMGAVSVAQALIAAKKRVIFIEAGPILSSLRSRPAVLTENVGRCFGTAVSRGLEFGGGTGFWHGICAPLDETDFTTRAWIPHSGWPISLADLQPWYRVAQEFLLGESVDVFGGAEVEDFERRGQGVFEPKAFCYRSAPFRAKSMLEKWCQESRVRCIYNSTALRMFVKHGTAHTLLVGTGLRTFKVTADRFVIAAGALETPRLLLNTVCNPTASPTEISWWLGRNLIDHPAGYFSQLTLGRRHDFQLTNSHNNVSALTTFRGMILRQSVQRDYGLPNHALFVRIGVTRTPVKTRAMMSFLGVRGAQDLRIAHLTSVVRNPYVLWRVVQQKFPMFARSRYRDLFFMTEQLPSPFSQVSLSTSRRDEYGYPIARVDWRLSRADSSMFNAYHELISSTLRRGMDVEKFREDPLARWHETCASSSHHLGTARMASTIRQGVVDPNLKVFGLNNVWVGDGSVFPTAGNVNPSLTICALGHRLGAHLNSQTQHSAAASIASLWSSKETLLKTSSDVRLMR